MDNSCRRKRRKKEKKDKKKFFLVFISHFCKEKNAHTHSATLQIRNQVPGNARYLCETCAHRTLGLRCDTSAHTFMCSVQQMHDCLHSIRYRTRLCTHTRYHSVLRMNLGNCTPAICMQGMLWLVQLALGMCLESYCRWKRALCCRLMLGLCGVWLSSSGAFTGTTYRVQLIICLLVLLEQSRVPRVETSDKNGVSEGKD